MPRLPSAPELAPVGFTPARGVTDIPVDPMGATLSKFGETLSTMAEKETQKLNALVVQNALTATEQERLRQTYDPKDGFLGVTGTQILDRPLLKDVPESFNRFIEATANGLTSPEQQALYRTHAQSISRGMQRDLYRHVAAQTDKAYAEGEASNLKLQQTKVAVNPEFLESSMQQAMLTLQKTFARTNPEQATKELMVQQTQTNLVSLALKSYTTGENPNIAAAQEVLRKYADILPQPLVAELKDHLAGKERQVIATTLSNDLYDAYTNGTTSVTEAERIMSEYGKADKKLHDETRQLFYQNVQALNIKRDETKGDLITKFMDNPSVKAKRTALGSEDFKGLDGGRKAAIQQYVDSILQQKLSQGREDIRWKWSVDAHTETEKEKKWFNDPKKIEQYQNLIDDPNLGARKSGYGIGFAPELGATLAHQIEAERARQASGAAKSTYAKEVLADLTPPDLLKPKNKDALNSYKGLAYSYLLDWKTTNPGKIPTEEEQRSLLKNATKEYVREIPYWLNDKEKAYNLKQMPQDFVDQTQQMFQKKIGRKATLQELMDGWAKQKGAY